MNIEKLCEEFHEKVGKEKGVKIVVEESLLNSKKINIYSTIAEISNEKENIHTENAKVLLIPTISYLSRVLEAYQNKKDAIEIKNLTKQFKESFKFPLKNKFLLYP